MGGQFVMSIGCWYQQWATIMLGALLVIAAGMFGLEAGRPLHEMP
jgi:hypothetical protein